jgi:hypothetical protein
VKIKVKERRTTETAVEVAFPFYRRHIVGDEHEITYATKVYLGPDGRPMELTLRRGCRHCPQTEWEIETRLFNPTCDDAEYVLGRGRYAMTREEWEAELAEFRAWLASALAAAG